MAIERTSRTTEKISARTVLTEPRIAPRMARASSAPPTESQKGSAMFPRAAARSTAIVNVSRGNAERPVTAMSINPSRASRLLLIWN